MSAAGRCGHVVHVGDGSADLGEHDRSLKLYGELCDTAAANGDHRSQRLGRVEIGRVLLKEDRFDEAFAVATAVLEQARAAGDFRNVVVAQWLLASIAVWCGWPAGGTSAEKRISPKAIRRHRSAAPGGGAAYDEVAERRAAPAANSARDDIPSLA